MSGRLVRKAPRLASLLFAATTLSLAGVASAQAQPFFGFFGGRVYDTPELLSPELVYRQLVRSGYQPIGRIHRNGRVFLADVFDGRRRQLRLVIDSFDGTVLERYAVAGRGPAIMDERPPLQSSLPMADPNLPPPRLLPPASAPRAEEPPSRPTKPRTIARTPSQERSHENRAATAPAAQEPAAKAAPVEQPQTETADVAPPPPAAPPASRRTAPVKAAPPKAEGPGYANGVPINPLE